VTPPLVARRSSLVARASDPHAPAESDALPACVDLSVVGATGPFYALVCEPDGTCPTRMRCEEPLFPELGSICVWPEP